MAKLFATERAQQRHRQGGAAARRRRRAPRPHRRAALSRNPRAAHLRRRVRSAESHHRTANAFRSMTMALQSLGRSAHTDTFTRDNLPPSQQWPEIPLDGFDYPETLNVGVELTDRMVARGFGDHVALIGNGRRRTYKELSDWTNRIAHALVEDFGIKPGNRILVRSANNPAMVACWLAATKAGAVVVNTMPMLRAGELGQNRRQGRSGAGAVRHAADGRARHLRQDLEIPQAGDRLRRHRQSRRRARPHRAEQGGDLRRGARPAATTSRCSASPRAPPASRRRPCISIAIC